MHKSTISSDPDTEKFMTSQTSQFNLCTEPQYPLREGWVGSRASLVDLERRKFLLEFEVFWLVGFIDWLVGWICWWVKGLFGWLVGQSVRC